jgi:hypothetical protein
MGRKVPLVTDIAKTEADRQAISMILGGVAIGRSLISRPGMPADRAAALRKAFDATMKDPEFLALAKRQKMDVNPMSGAEVQKIAVGVVNSSAEAKKRLGELLKPSDVKKLKAESLVGMISKLEKCNITITDASGKSVSRKIHPRCTAVKFGGKNSKTKNLKKEMSCSFKYLGGVTNPVTNADCK